MTGYWKNPELTAAALKGGWYHTGDLGYLDERGYLYLIINQQTAMSTRPVSENWLTTAFRGLDATLERLRIDRQLDEAITSGPDPLHLAAVFGIDDTTAIRYATVARQLLDTAAEHHTPG